MADAEAEFLVLFLKTVALPVTKCNPLSVSDFDPIRNAFLPDGGLSGTWQRQA